MGRNLAVALVFLFAVSGAHAATQAQIDQMRAKAYAWLFQNQKGDGSWSATDGLEVHATSAVLDAFINVGIKRGNNYNAAVANLANVTPSSIDGQSRQLSTLYRTGSDVSQLGTQLQASANAFKTWGAFPGHAPDPLDTALAVSALYDTTTSYSNATSLTALCSAILTKQNSADLGWSYNNAPSAVATSAITPTAYAILTLQKAISRGLTSGTCSGTNYTFSTVIGNGITFLLAKQNADHGFGDNGTSGVLETALAYGAIQAANPGNPALSSAQDYLVGMQQATGGWANDPFQTALALQTLPATTLTDTDKDGIPDAVETVLATTNPTIADGRGLLPGNGQAVTGITSPQLLLTAPIYQPFNYQINASGGTAPYHFMIVAGELPGGLTLASSGAIAGTPSIAGAFSFIYEISDNAGNTQTVNGQFQIESPVQVAESDAPTLPEWGVLLMGSILLLTMFRANRPRRH